MADASAAYTAFRAHSKTRDTAAALSGTLPPGTYVLTSTTVVSSVTLDFQSNPSAFYEFIITGSLTTSASSSVIPLNGGATDNCRIFWFVSTTATLGAGSRFAGTLVAAGAISVGANARINGRLASTGAGISLSSNFVNATACSSVVSSCSPCEAGYDGSAGANTCTACPVGKYKPGATPEACSDCFAHSNITTTGNIGCQCLPGYEALGRTGLCTPCPLGTYKSALGNGNCTACTDVPHFTTDAVASTSSNQCGCAHGYYAATAGGTACKSCDQGSYTDAVRSTSCTNCSTDGSAAIGRAATACAVCPTGYTNNSANTLCSIDLDECTLGTHNCSDVCTNTVGGFTCSCLPGTTRVLGTDGVTCSDPSNAGSGTTVAKTWLWVFFGALMALFLVALCGLGGKNYMDRRQQQKYSEAVDLSDFRTSSRGERSGRYSRG
jgi:hypothetical protein